MWESRSVAATLAPPQSEQHCSQAEHVNMSWYQEGLPLCGLVSDFNDALSEAANLATSEEKAYDR